MGMRYSPGWAVGWWFIPVAWWVMPFRTMRELWLASGPEAGAADWGTHRLTPLIPLWWMFWILRWGLAIISGATTRSDPSQPMFSYTPLTGQFIENAAHFGERHGRRRISSASVRTARRSCASLMVSGGVKLITFPSSPSGNTMKPRRKHRFGRTIAESPVHQREWP